jgi:hypothetical protein
MVSSYAPRFGKTSPKSARRSPCRTRIEAPRLATLSGRLQTLDSSVPPPVQRMLPWNTCRERQGLVRFPTLSSGECDFMSQRTLRLTDAGPMIAD